MSGRVIFPGNVRPKAPEGAPLRVSAHFTESEDGPRTMFLRPDNGVIDESGRFQLRDCPARCCFACGATVNLVLKSVTLNGADITDTQRTTQASGDISGP